MTRLGYITGTRADFGRIKPLLNRFEEDDSTKLHLIVTGMHLSEKFGYTYSDFCKDFRNTYLIQTLDKFNDKSITSTPLQLSFLISELTILFNDINLDYLIVLGDRFEMLAAALAAAHLNITVFHIAGGDFSGSIDDKYRDMISIISNYHFVSIEQHRQKLLRFNLPNKNIFVSGSLDVTAIRQLGHSINKLENINNKLKLKISKENYAVLIYHPDTNNIDFIDNELNNILKFLNKLNLKTIVIKPNSDYGHNIINNIYNKLDEKQFLIFDNIIYEDFIAVLKNSRFMIGNSSSGILECSYLEVPFLNVGLRQNNRFRGANVLDVKDINKIVEYYLISQSNEFKEKMRNDRLIYGDGKSDIFLYNLIKSIFMKGGNYE